MSQKDPTPSTTLEVSPGLAIADLGGEAVLLDPTTGRYFGLNEVASRILEVAHEPTTVSGVVDQLLDEFEVDRPRLEADVLLFVKDLSSRGLLLLDHAP